MRKLPWAVLVVITCGAAINTAAGCGSETNPDIGSGDGGDEGTGADGNTNPPTNPPTDPPTVPPTNPPADDGGFFDVTTDGSRPPDSSTPCTAVSGSCTTSTQCCSANCDTTSGTCGNPKTGCELPGAACVSGNQCCTGSCVSGTCSNLVCVPDNQSCAVSSDCCSGQCQPQATGGGKCLPLGTKPVSGNPCTTNSQCASGWCNAGICANPSFCTVDGDICSTDNQCCGGKCSKAAGAPVGICANIGGSTTGGPCLPAGELCSPNGTCTGASCCSRSCAPSPTSGLGVCQPESGCHLIGDLCQSTTDCCGVKDLPGSIKTSGGQSTDVQCQKAAGATFGVCNYVTTVCTPAGDLCKPGNATSGGAQSCSTKADCCAGNDNQFPTCQIDSNGIPRCTVQPNLNCDGGKPPAGTQCASSADCCGDPCIANPDPGTVATKPFVCGAPGSCQSQGTSCTSSSDCCTGLPCAIPPGGVKGVCGGTILPDGGVSDAAPPGTDGGVIPPPDGGPDSSVPPDASTCALYGQTCAANSDCCSGVPCVNGTCHFP